MHQKGGALLISILLSSLIIAVIGIYELQGSWEGNTKSGYAQDIDVAKETEIKFDFKEIQAALESYRLSKGQYPSTLEDLVKNSSLSSIPKNPYTNKDYVYESASSTFSLTTTLGDGSNYQITN